MAARLDRLDLKMLRVLATLAHTRNTYRAAEQLNLTQSAVSRALGRLRDVLDDPLFIRTADGMQPTELTERVVARLPELFDLLESVVEGEEQFDPESWHGSATIALCSPVTHCWGAGLYEVLARRAPNVQWCFETWRPTTATDIMEGRIAFGIHFANERWPQALYQQELVEDEYVLMARSDHPARKGDKGLDLFREYPLLSLLLPDWNDHGNLLETELRTNEIEPTVGLRTENLTLALESLEASNALMPGTRSLVQREPGLAELPYPPELTIPNASLVICYPRRLRNSNRYHWLSQTVLDLLIG